MALLCALYVSLASVGPVVADGDHALDPVVNLAPDGLGGGFGVGRPGPDRHGSPPAELRYVVVHHDACMLGVLPNADGTFDTIWGLLYVTLLVDGDGNEQVVDTVCVPDTDPPPAAPPPPPSAAEVWGLVPLPDARIGISPTGDGLTGIATLLWYEGGSEPVTLGPLRLRGYSLTATAKPVEYCWRMGDAPTLDAQTTYCTGLPGSSDNPAASHVYERRGDYTVRLQVSWEGTYTFSGFGVTTDRALGALPVVRTRPYHVAEARSVRR